MLQNKYSLKKIGFDTAENEPSKNLAELQIYPSGEVLRAETDDVPFEERAAAKAAEKIEGFRRAGRVRAVKVALPSPHLLLGRSNLTGLVLGCIEAKFCKKICV